ncbi:hypothetical protein [Streptomyces noursei]|uniref:Uncharacterized protein n=1 Tax=Streptomyces noursei TaxID=1971 RepID=A0A401QRD7_STRNR|nr:hypothetical protein [Streptomyces noursei]GCB87961.1 hypothetical protein SALB_00630 [Streptomyces noursei]
MLDTPPDGHGAEVELTITHALPAARRKGGSVRLEAQITAVRDGQLLGAAHLRYTCHSPAIYERLRGQYADARAATSHAPLPALRCRPRMWPLKRQGRRALPDCAPGAGNCG